MAKAIGVLFCLVGIHADSVRGRVEAVADARDGGDLIAAAVMLDGSYGLLEREPQAWCERWAPQLTHGIYGDR